VLQQLFVGVELAVFAGVVEGDVAVSPAIALIDFATVEGLGIDVDADGALIKFGQVQNLVDGLEGIYVDGMRAVHFVDFRGNDFAGAAGGIFFVDAEILDFQAADGGGHPTILIAMIVDAAVLPNFPTDSHALEEIVFENQVAGVIAFGEKEIFFERLGTDGVLDDVVLDRFESEGALRERDEAFDPVSDGELLDGELFLHGRKIITPKRRR
jgi:hypothetical protein